VYNRIIFVFITKNYVLERGEGAMFDYRKDIPLDGIPNHQEITTNSEQTNQKETIPYPFEYGKDIPLNEFTD
jgi:hypothetical protein